MVMCTGRSTTASIDADAFSLPDFYRGSEEPSSKVDFSIGLRLSPEIQRRLSRRIAAVNPTLYEPVRLSPIAVHIETKLTGGFWRAARSQLSIGVTQHVAKLRELLALAGQPDRVQLPILPLLVSQGHDWICLLFEDQGDGAQLHSSFPIGSSEKVLDAHAAVAGMHFLMDWAQTDYREWFEEVILQPLLGTIPSDSVT